MQHIEYAGIHSGDSACVIPSVVIAKDHKKTIYDYTRKIAMELKVVGLMNIQYAIYEDTVYILEANPRASRTVPLVSKVCNISMARIAMELKVVGLMNIQYAIYENTVYILEANPRASRTVPLVSKVCNISMARIATQILLGQRLSDFNLKNKTVTHFGVKEAVFPFNMFPAIDPLLGPEMRSTGEVLGMADSYGMAFFKSQEATQSPLPIKGTVLITIADRDKDRIIDSARNFRDMGFRILSTGGTRQFLAENGIEAELILKVH
jgi:carbamoyl-phosphate synthase large subunit